jgi:hypothetical protein
LGTGASMFTVAPLTERWANNVHPINTNAAKAVFKRNIFISGP